MSVRREGWLVAQKVSALWTAAAQSTRHQLACQVTCFVPLQVPPSKELMCSHMS